MDIEQLNKTQIVLLTLLISFVTSIATGIVTVTLMDQAPPVVTQTISRVVERTIERVVSDKSQQTRVITKETTVIIKEEDLITQAIEQNVSSVVRIFTGGSDGTGVFVALGIIVTADGIIATDGASITPGILYRIEMASGEVFAASVARLNGDIALLQIDTPEVESAAETDEEQKEAAEQLSFRSVFLGDESALKLGQSVIALSGRERTSVSMGIISAFITYAVPDMDLSNSGVEEEEGAEEQVVDVSAEVPTSAEPESTVSQFGSFVSRIVGGESADTNTETETLASAPLPSIAEITTSIWENDVLAGGPLIDIFGNTIGINIAAWNTYYAVYAPTSAVIAELTALAAVEATALKAQQSAVLEAVE